MAARMPRLPANPLRCQHIPGSRTAATLRSVPVSDTPALLADPGFAPVSEDDWEAAADRALRGAPLSSLRRTLLGGIETAPLYSPHRHSTEGDPAGLPGASPHARGAAATSGSGGWEVRQAHDVTLPGTPDAIAIDTTSGVDAVTVARGWNADSDRAALAAGIGDAACAGVTIHLQSGTSPAHAAALADVLELHSVDAERVRSWLGLDPIAAAASGWSRTEARDGTELVSAMCSAARSGSEIAQRSPLAVPLEADGSVFADAGASDATELAAMLATGVAWLRAICDSPDGPGLDPTAGARLLGFTLSAGPDPFGVTAKCRALRICWTRILSACGVVDTIVEGLPMRLHAVTSTAMLSALDPWVNMLRATTATFGAANGGVDAITVRPFDSVTAGPASSGLGWRVAANTQLILRHESRIGSVIDPAGGSWYLEDLTRKTAQAAWDRFGEIEASGGICAVMASGEAAASIAAERAQRDERIATGDQVLVGVTDFADSAGASVAADLPAGTLAGGLGTHRWAAPYESGAPGSGAPESGAPAS